jgi:hypothetical protein
MRIFEVDIQYQLVPNRKYFGSYNSEGIVKDDNQIVIYAVMSC